MKNLIIFIFSFLTVFVFAAANAKAAVHFVDGEQSIDFGEFTLEIVDADGLSRVVVEKTQINDYTYQLGFYPSSADIKYKLHLVDEWLYRPINIADWSHANYVISEKDIYVRDNAGPSREVLGEKVETEESTSEEAENVVIEDRDINTSVKSIYKDEVEVFSSVKTNIKATFAPVQNKDLNIVSSFYEVDAAGNDFVIDIHYRSDTAYSKSIYEYDRVLDQWIEIRSYNQLEDKFISADILDKDGPVVLAIFEDPNATDGIASFYDQSWYGTFDYKNGNFAASRDYPKGTKLKVTRLKTGESIVIEVNDYGPEAWTGRIIDLDVAAFEQLGSRGAGLIYVKVEPL